MQLVLIFSVFAILITMYLGVVLLGLILFETVCFLDLDVCFVSQVRKFPAIMSSNMSSDPFLFFSNANVSVLCSVPDIS